MVLCGVVRVGSTDVAPPGVAGFVEAGGDDVELLEADVMCVSVWLGFGDVDGDIGPVERKGTAVVLPRGVCVACGLVLVAVVVMAVAVAVGCSPQWSWRQHSTRIL